MHKTKSLLYQAKVIKIDKNFYQLKLKDNQQIIRAELTGRLKHQKINIIVGDNVEIIDKGLNQNYFIHQRYPRINELKRPKISNVESVFLVASFVEPTLDLFFLTKLILWISIKIQIKPILVLTKMDLIDYTKNPIKEKIDWYKKYYQVILTDKTKETKPLIIKKNINVLMGRSGVGKSTLINRLKPSLNLKTAAVSTKSKLGKHQTTNNEFFFIKNKLIADTPGFNDINLKDVTKLELLKNFVFFNINKQNQCHFQPCYHDHEPKCHIKNEVLKNTETKFWWEMWKKILLTLGQKN